MLVFVLVAWRHGVVIPGAAVAGRGAVASVIPSFGLAPRGAGVKVTNPCDLE